MSKKIKIIVIVAIVLCVGVVATYIAINREEYSEMTYVKFIENVKNKNVNKVVFDDTKNIMKVVLNNDITVYQVPNPKKEDFTEYLLLNNIIIEYNNSKPIIGYIQSLIFIMLGVGIFFYARSNGNSSKLIIDAKKEEDNVLKFNFDSVEGNIEAKALVEDIIKFIKNPKKYSDLGARMPRGILFYGPPGTGKTLMAKAVAGEADVPFYAMSGSDFVQMYVGVGASRIRSLFNKAKKSEKAVIFIDEIDAIGKKRGRNVSASNDERDQTLNALLTEMSGFNTNNGIIVIAATNRLDTLDEALLRPGRFDRQIEIGLPDVNARKSILQLHCKNKPLSSEVNLDSLAKATVYFSGAMLENLLNESAIFAANEERKIISQIDIDKAFYTVLAGSEKKDRSYISERERQITAYHEAGHALITKILLPEYYISKVTIIPSIKGAGGFNLSIPNDAMYKTKKQIKANIQMLLAGRIAEEIIFGNEEITTGASNDIQKASTLMMDFINKFGMDSEFGMFNTEMVEGYYDEELINKCRNEINKLYIETKDLLERRKELLIRITKVLLERETINGVDIDELCCCKLVG